MTDVATKYFLYEIRETDSNDCAVYDCIVTAATEDEANEQVGEHFAAMAKAKGWESDGNFCSYYFPCDCEQPEGPFDDPSECDQCEVLSINGVACHETECPTYRRYKRDLKAYERWEDRECSHGGLTVGDPQQFDTEEEAFNAHSRFHSMYEIW